MIRGWVSGGQGCYRLTRGGTGPSHFRAWVALASARFPVEYPVLRVCIKRPGHLITLLQQKNWFQLKFQSLSYWFQLKTFDIQGPAVSQPFQFQGYTLVQSLSWERRCSRVSRRSGLSIGGRV